MTLIVSPYEAVAQDLIDACKPWIQSLNDNTWQRQKNTAAVLRSLAMAINRVLGRYPRVMAQMNTQMDYLEMVGADPLYQWHYNDSWDNGRTNTVSIVAVPRTAGAADCYAGRYTGGVPTEVTPLFNTPAAASTDEFEDCFKTSYEVSRGAAAGGVITESMSTFSGFTVCSYSVQDDEIGLLDTTLHNYIDIGLARRGHEILADMLETIRSMLHLAATENLRMLFNWSAQRLAAGWATPGATNQTAIVCNNVSQVNLIDQTFTARTAQTPGLSCNVQYNGWGASDENNGKLVKCMCRVNAAVAAGAGQPAYVRFHGPNFAAGGGANNYTDITITNGLAAAWYGDNTNYVYLDSTVADTDVTTNRNKVDVFGWIPGVTTEILYAYGLSGWQHAPPY